MHGEILLGNPTNKLYFFFLKRGYVSSFQQAARLPKPHRDKKPLLNPFLLWLTLAMCVPPDFLIPLPVRARSTELNGYIIHIQGHPDFLLKKNYYSFFFQQRKKCTDNCFIQTSVKSLVYSCGFRTTWWETLPLTSVIYLLNQTCTLPSLLLKRELQLAQIFYSQQDHRGL